MSAPQNVLTPIPPGISHCRPERAAQLSKRRLQVFETIAQEEVPLGGDQVEQRNEVEWYQAKLSFRRAKRYKESGQVTANQSIALSGLKEPDSAATAAKERSNALVQRGHEAADCDPSSGTLQLVGVLKEQAQRLQQALTEYGTIKAFNTSRLHDGYSGFADAT